MTLTRQLQIGRVAMRVAMTRRFILRPQCLVGYKHKQHPYNYGQRQNGGRKFNRYCKRGHDKKAPHGLKNKTECAVCARAAFNRWYARQ